MLGSQTIHQHKDGEIVSDSRQDGSSSDAAVRDTQHLSHDECADAHDGGHDLTASGSDCLNSARLLRLVADLLHHRDGHDTGGCDVCDSRTGDHAHQAGRDDGCLCGAAGGLVGELHADVDQQLTAAHRGEESTEHDEVEQGICGGVQRSSEDAALAHRHADAELLDELCEGLALGEQDAGQIGRSEGVQDEDRNEDGQDDAQRAVHGDEQQNDGHDHEDVVDAVDRLHRDKVQQAGVLADNVPQHISEADEQQDVKPVHPSVGVQLLFVHGLALSLGCLCHFLAVSLVSRVVQENQSQCKDQMQGTLQHGVELLDQSQIHLKGEEHNGDDDGQPVAYRFLFGVHKRVSS